jgi:hypothetical protein
MTDSMRDIDRIGYDDFLRYSSEAQIHPQVKISNLVPARHEASSQQLLLKMNLHRSNDTIEGFPQKCPGRHNRFSMLQLQVNIIHP